MRQQQIGQGEAAKWKHEVEERGDDAIFFLEYHQVIAQLNFFFALSLIKLNEDNVQQRDYTKG